MAGVLLADLIHFLPSRYSPSFYPYVDQSIMVPAQMQPHFIYNVSSAIQVIIKRDADYAHQS
jgi:hypothetical protein